MNKSLLFVIAAITSSACALEKDATVESIINEGLIEICGNNINSDECQQLRNDIESKLEEFVSYADLVEYMSKLVTDNKCSSRQKQNEKQNAQ